MPSLEASTIDMGVSGFTDTPKRRKSFDFVNYMHAGVVVESGTPNEVLNNPQHERTQAFLSSLLK